MPFGVKSELASAFHIPESQVRVIVPDTGAAYGGKHTGEAAIEAAPHCKAGGEAGASSSGRVKTSSRTPISGPRV